MKNLLAGLLLIFGLAARAQTFTPIHNYQQPDGLSVYKYFGVPYGPTPVLNVTRTVPGALFYNTSDSSLYSWSGTFWARATGGVVISPSAGVDSLTISGNVICQWRAGVSTCYALDRFVTDMGLSADRFRYILYNFMGDSLKTVEIPHTIAEQGAGMVLTRRGDTINFASTGTGTGRDSFAFYRITSFTDSTFTFHNLKNDSVTILIHGGGNNGITALTGDVTASGTGSVAATIGPLKVINSMIANGTIDLTGKVTNTLPIANGGTNAITANGAFNNLAPSQVGNSGKVLTTDGNNTSWATIGGGTGTVTSIAFGLGLTGGTITTTGGVALDTASVSVLSRQRGAATYEPIISVLPIAKGGTNNGSLSVTAGTLYYGDGTKLIGLAPGTSNQHLTGGATPAWRDTAVAGGAAVTPGGSNTFVQYNNSGAFGGDSTFVWSNLGVGYYNKKYAGLRITPSVTAQANTDTLVAFLINNKYKPNGKSTLKIYDMQINSYYLRADSLWNLSIGNGGAAVPAGGFSTFIGIEAGGGATSAESSNFIGRYAGNSASGANKSNFLGNVAGYLATNANSSNFFGYTAGQAATNANNSNFFGNAAGTNATNASNSSFLGQNAGSGATGANNSNFFGASAGINATGASQANFFGQNAGANATSAIGATFFGSSAGSGATGASYSNFFGNGTGAGATGGSYSNYLGWQVCDSLTYKITGSNNHVIGTNITLPSAATANSLDIGNVLYAVNLYNSIVGNPASAAQTTGRVGINISTPAVSAILDLTSTTTGLLLPRMTKTQRDAIVSPVAGLAVYQTDNTPGMRVYNGTNWMKFSETTD